MGKGCWCQHCKNSLPPLLEQVQPVRARCGALLLGVDFLRQGAEQSARGGGVPFDFRQRDDFQPNAEKDPTDFGPGDKRLVFNSQPDFDDHRLR